jgi:hypothetical protein
MAWVIATTTNSRLVVLEELTGQRHRVPSGHMACALFPTATIDTIDQGVCHVPLPTGSDVPDYFFTDHQPTSVG